MELWLWAGFVGLIAALLALDLGVLNRKSHVIGAREALGWSAFWILLALLFNAFVYFAYQNNWCGIGVEIGYDMSGAQAALEFFTAYLLEKSLSLDNIFVIAMIFAYFRVPREHQHRVLFWGIIGAVFMRGAMIAAGVVLIRHFEWVIYVFGALLLLAAAKILWAHEASVHPAKNLLVRAARRLFPVTSDFDGHRFVTRVEGVFAVTPMFLVLLVVESTDVLFAVDSIPAVFAVTRDPFLVFTSNIFAILGLRSLYFALAAMLDRFAYLRFSLVGVLAFVGVKMILAHSVEIPTSLSLGVIGAMLAAGVVASIWRHSPRSAGSVERFPLRP